MSLIDLINRWFATDYPVVNVDSFATDILERSVLDGGVFGFNINDHATINTVKNHSKLVMYYRMVFPSYDRMVVSYPRLRGRRYLLPYYYLCRLIDKGFRKKGYKHIGTPSIEKVNKRQQFVDVLQLNDQYYSKLI